MTTVVRGRASVVHLACARLDEDWLATHDPMDEVTAAERRPARRDQYLGVRSLLRRLLRTLDPALAALPVDRSASGRPVLRGGPPEIGVSLSHDAEILAVAVADVPTVGVDVQQPLETADDLLLRRCLARHAPTVLGLPGDVRRRVTAEVWTVQEACVKAEGSGLSARPWTIDVEPGAPHGRWGDYAWRTLHDAWPVPAAVAWGEPDAATRPLGGARVGR